MKKLLLLFILLTSINSFSQINELINNDWYLSDLTMQGENHPPPLNEEIPYIEADFFQTDIPEFQTRLCGDYLYKGFSWDAATENSQINFWGGQWYENSTDCVNPDFSPNNQNYKELYYNFFKVYEDVEIFNYEIQVNNDGSKSLTLTNPGGDVAIYSNAIMSTQDLNNYSVNLFPNPVEERLTIENKDSKITNIQIVDSNGKLLINQKINSDKTEINFAAYPKGIYFIQFESEGKIIKTEKIIKN